MPKPRAVLLLAGISLLWGQHAAEPPAFEVAAVEPAAPLAGGEMAMTKLRVEAALGDMMPGMIPRDKARVTIRGRSLLTIVAMAYAVPSRQIDGPEWMADARFNIEAKIPEGADKQVHQMLQTLLAVRFGLKLHRETRDIRGYALVIGKNGPKLTPSSNTPDAQRAGGADLKKNLELMQGNGLMLAGGSRRSFHRASMQSIARALSAELNSPVADLTGLTGSYDLSWETRPPETPGDGPEYAVSQAIARFGLKLERRKLPLEILVVDRVSKTPTPN